MQTYKLTNTRTGMSYVGATIRPLANRLSDHWKAATQGRTTLICKAIREFGKDAFVAEILNHTDSFEELMTLEIEAIRAHNTLEPNGYNRASGGIGTPDCRHLESTKLKISEKAKGRIIPEAVRQKISAKLKGKTSPTKGMKFGPAWNRGLRHTEEAKLKMSAAHSGNKNWNVRSVEVNGTVYPSTFEAVRKTGLSRTQIRYMLKTGRAEYRSPRMGKPLPPATEETKAKISASKMGASNGRSTAIEINAVAYPSVRAAMDGLGLTRYIIDAYIRTGRARYITPPPQGATKQKEEKLK